jgi:hypothetical protein
MVDSDTGEKIALTDAVDERRLGGRERFIESGRDSLRGNVLSPRMTAIAGLSFEL